MAGFVCGLILTLILVVPLAANQIAALVASLPAMIRHEGQQHVAQLVEQEDQQGEHGQGDGGPALDRHLCGKLLTAARASPAPRAPYPGPGLTAPRTTARERPRLTQLVEQEDQQGEHGQGDGGPALDRHLCGNPSPTRIRRASRPRPATGPPATDGRAGKPRAPRPVPGPGPDGARPG
jgi:hypothetical protein